MRLFPPAFVARRCVEPAMRPPRASAGEKILHFFMSRYLCVTTLDDGRHDEGHDPADEQYDRSNVARRSHS